MTNLVFIISHIFVFFTYSDSELGINYYFLTSSVNDPVLSLAL